MGPQWLSSVSVIFKSCRCTWLDPCNVHVGAVQALIDAPTETRHVENFKRLTLTDFKLDIPRLANKKTLTAKWTEAGELQQPTTAPTWNAVGLQRTAYSGS